MWAPLDLCPSPDAQLVLVYVQKEAAGTAGRSEAASQGGDRTPSEGG